MSNGKFPTTVDFLDTVLDIERIIAEVERRPPLYNKHMEEYNDRSVKRKLWEEVCVNVVHNWMELTPMEKHYKKKEIQKKWKNVKDCFGRELATQRKLGNSESARKRRKYIYFDLLLFLLPTTKSRPSSRNTVPIENNYDNSLEKSDIPKLDPTFAKSDNNEEHLNIPTRRPKKTRKNLTSFENSLLNILQKNEEIDEDKQFALMLVPMLQKLNDEQKHHAKVEILNVMRYAKNYQSPSVLPYSDINHTNIVSPTSTARDISKPSLQFSLSNCRTQPSGLQTRSKSYFTNDQN